MKFEKIYGAEIDPQKLEEELFLNSVDEVNENEIEKSEFDIEVINLWENKINEYIKRLNIEKKFYISDDQIRFIDDRGFFADGNFFGYMDGQDGTIYIDSTREKILIYKTILHEMIHLSSYRAAHIEKEKNIINGEDDIVILETRTGYDLGGNKMNSFNESITEIITNEILVQNKDFFESKNIDLKPLETFKAESYAAEIQVFNTILTNLAKYFEKEYEEVFQEIKQGYFAGQMMHLRKVEKVYGKNFLIFLAQPEFIFENSDLSFEEIIGFYNLTNTEERNDYIKNVLLAKEKGDEKYNEFLRRVNLLSKR